MPLKPHMPVLGLGHTHTRSLILSYLLNESGVNLTDAVTNFDGTVSSDVWFNSEYGSALDCSSSYIKANAHRNIEDIASGEFSFTGIIKLSELSEEEVDIYFELSKNASPSDNYMRFQQTGGVGFQFITNDGGESYTLTDEYSLNDGEWHVIAVTVDGDAAPNVNIYIDGVNVVSGSVDNHPSCDTLYLSGTNAGKTSSGSSSYALIEFHNIELTSEDVSAFTNDPFGHYRAEPYNLVYTSKIGAGTEVNLTSAGAFNYFRLKQYEI